MFLFGNKQKNELMLLELLLLFQKCSRTWSSLIFKSVNLFTADIADDRENMLFKRSCWITVIFDIKFNLTHHPNQYLTN